MVISWVFVLMGIGLLAWREYKSYCKMMEWIREGKADIDECMGEE